MKNHTPFNTDFTDGQLAILNELLDYLDNTEPTSFELRNNFIAPKCKYILAQIEIEREIINGYAEGVNEVLNAVPDNSKSLFETLGEICRPENIPQNNLTMKKNKMKICPDCLGTNEILSDCCGAKIDTDILICSDCLDHSGIAVCDTCEGTGEVEIKNNKQK